MSDIVKRTTENAISSAAIELWREETCSRIVRERGPYDTLGSLMMAAMKAEAKACADLAEPHPMAAHIRARATP